MAEKILSVDQYIMDHVIKKIDEKKFLRLNRTERTERISLFIIAMVLGCKCKQRKPLQHKCGLIRLSAIHDEEMAVLKAVCLNECIENNENYDDINDIEVIFKIAEEYANTGFYELEKNINNFESIDEDIDENTDLWESLVLLDKKYRVLFEND